MNEELISNAVECYINKLREENKILKDTINQIIDTFKPINGKSRKDSDVMEDIIILLRVHQELFKAGENNDR